MTRLVLNSGAAGRQIFELPPGIYRLGRAADNDLIFLDPALSGYHSEIRVEGDQVRVRDLRTTNGTRIDGQLIREAELLPGQILQIGALQFVVEDNPLSHIAIPDLPPPVAETPTSIFFDDGTVSCLVHQEVVAEFHCDKCDVYYCAVCVRTMRRKGGTHTLVFCPKCSGSCQPAVFELVNQKKRGFFKTLIDHLKAQTAKLTTPRQRRR